MLRVELWTSEVSHIPKHNAVGYLLEVVSKTLLKTSHTSVTVIKLILNQKPYFYWLAFKVLDNALLAYHRRKDKIYLAVNPANYGNWTGKTAPIVQ